MLCFLEEKENGTLHKDWLDVVVAFCDKMIEIQNTDGSWYRAYTMEGTPMTYPEEWFGSNVIEQGSGTIFPGEVLALVHELGHLVCGICLGLKLKSIKITPVGFQILFKNNIQDYNIKIQKGNEICIKKIAIAFAGPLVNIFIAIIAFFMPENIVAQKETIIYANLMLAIFNLLPIYPLDGGRIVKEIINIKIINKLIFYLPYFSCSSLLLLILTSKLFSSYTSSPSISYTIST